MKCEGVPLQLRNNVTKLKKEIGYGKGYKHAHKIEDKITNIKCLPDNLVG